MMLIPCFSFFSSGKNIDGVLADPFMMLIPPIEQFSHEYIFATPDDERVKKEFDNYVTLVVKTEEKAGKTWSRVFICFLFKLFDTAIKL